jgi:histidine triad (HIT) family protein
MDCIFCKIGAKEVQAAIVMEDEHAYAVLDAHPIAPGHTMVIPKMHAVTILDLPKEEMEPVFLLVQKMTARLKEVLNADGFTIGMNHGDAGGQAVKHLHIHIVPRFTGDGGRSIHSVVNNPGTEDIGVLAARLKSS